MHGVMCNAMSNGMERDWELCSFGIHEEFSLFPYRLFAILILESFVQLISCSCTGEISTKRSSLIN